MPNEKLVNLDALKSFRQKFQEKIESGRIVAGRADNLKTERTIEDLDISCPPITFGIAGGDAEIATGIQNLTTLYGNADPTIRDYTKLYVQSAKLLSCGKNQFTGFNEFIDVLSSEEYRIFTNLPSGLLLTEYDGNKETHNDDYYVEENIGSDVLIDDFDNSHNNQDFMFSEGTRYIKLEPADSSEVTDDTFVMMYITFGESYSEPYEEHREDEITLPDIRLYCMPTSRGTFRDEIYSTGKGLRRIKHLGLSSIQVNDAQSPVLTNNSLSFTLVLSKTKMPNPVVSPAISQNGVIIPLGEHVICSRWGDASVPMWKYVYRLNNQYLELELTLTQLPSGNYNNLDIALFGENLPQNILELFIADIRQHDLELLYVMAVPEELSIAENPGWESEIFIDNYGTLKYLKSNNEEITVKQPYEIIYTVDLKEFLDSSYVKAAGNASDIALRSELEEGDLVPALSSETESIAPYSEESGPTQDIAFTYQTTAGGSDCGDSANLINLKGQTVKYEKRKQYGTALSEPTPSGDPLCLSVYLEDTEYDLEKGTMSYTAERPSYASNIDHKYLYLFKQIETNHNAFNVTDYTYTDPDSGEEKTKHCGIFFKNKLAQILPLQSQSPDFLGFIVDGEEDLIFNLVTDDLSDGDVDFEENELMFRLKDVYWFDLTDMFGLGKEPKSFDDFQKAFPNIIYNIDGFIHTKPYKLLNTGYNQNKEEYEEGVLDSGGLVTGNSGTVSGFIRVLPNTKYGIFSNTNIDYIHFYKHNDPQDFSFHYEEIDNVEGTFTTPAGCQYIRFDIAERIVNPEVAIYIYWDGSKQTYESYKQWEYEFPNVTLRSVEDVCDELLPDGTLIRRVGYGTFQLNQPFELEPGSDKYYAELLMSNLDWTEPHKIKFEHSSEYIIDSENNVIMIYVGDGQGLVGMSQSDIDEYYSSCVYELEEPTEETVTPFASELSIDDFGTMAFTNRDAESLEINISQPCEIIYLADYVAFLDSVGYNSNYDADNIVYRTSGDFKEFFEDDSFIDTSGNNKAEDGKVTVLQQAIRKGPRSSYTKYKRNGDQIRMNVSAYYGTKKNNVMVLDDSDNPYVIYGTFTQTKIEQLIEKAFGSEIYNECSWFSSVRTLLDLDMNVSNRNDVLKELKNIGCFGTEAVFGFNTGVSIHYNVGNNEDFDNCNTDDNDAKYLPLGSFCRWNNTDYCSQVKSYTIKGPKKRLFKFVKNFEGEPGKRWYGTMASVGLELKLYSVLDWNDETVYNFIIPKFIYLK